MRSKVSGKTRIIVVAISVIIAALLVFFLFLKLKPYTKFLQEDIPKGRVICVDVKRLSDGDEENLPDDAVWSDADSVKEIIDSAIDSGAQPCLVELEYTFFSDVKESFGNFFMSVRGSDKTVATVYASSDLVMISSSEEEYTMKQYLVLDDADIVDVYFDKTMLPRSFKGPYVYELSYEVMATGEKRSTGFTTALKK